MNPTRLAIEGIEPGLDAISKIFSQKIAE
jgi:hypothetical protein